MHLGVLALVLALLAAPLAAEAQQAGKVARIGYLSLHREDGDKKWVEAFRQGLRELGYVEGWNVAIEQRHAAGRPEKLPELAAELVRLQIDVLVVYGLWPLIEAGWKAPVSLPIVVTVDADRVADRVGRGLAASLARPAGNVTGLSDAQADLVSKRLELLKEVVPSAVRVGVLFNPTNPQHRPQLKTAQAAALTLGLTVLPVELKGPEPNDVDQVFATIRKERLAGLLIISDPTIGGHRSRIVELATKSRLPAISTVKEWAEVGLLMSYSTNFADLWRRAATYVDKILKGANPGDLPIERPTKFELVINLRTARALDLKIPPSLLLRADHVIE